MIGTVSNVRGRVEPCRKASACGAAGVAALALIFTGAAPAHAQGRLDAHYAISAAGIPVGESTWRVEIGGDRYALSASGRASAMLRVVASGEGVLAASGLVADGRLSPTSFSAKTMSDDGDSEVRMSLEGGSVKEVAATTTVAGADRVPVTDAHRRDVTDPLTALIVPVPDGLTQDACRRTLPIFDGHRRFDLALSFKRMDNVKADRGYQGPVVVCAMALRAIAGHRPKSSLVAFLDGRDMELWLAPVAGTRLLAPFRLAVLSMLGNITIHASRFETTVEPLPEAQAVGAKTP